MLVYRKALCTRCGQAVKKIDGQSLRRIRISAGLGLREFARRLKLTAPYISDIELNRRGVTKRIEAEYMKLLR